MYYLLHVKQFGIAYVQRCLRLSRSVYLCLREAFLPNPCCVIQTLSSLEWIYRHVSSVKSDCKVHREFPFDKLYYIQYLSTSTFNSQKRSLHYRWRPESERGNSAGAVWGGRELSKQLLSIAFGPKHAALPEVSIGWKSQQRTCFTGF